MNSSFFRCLPLVSLLSLLCLSACGGGHGPATVPTVALALEGPPLAVIGDYAGFSLEGTLERSGMSGYGTLVVRGDVDGREFFCEAKLDAPPTEKGRVLGVFMCTGDTPMALSLRNLGPDQGVGIAKAATDDNQMMIFFYHASREEALRRFPAVKKDIDEARSKGAS